jgi:hypothetical protein
MLLTGYQQMAQQQQTEIVQESLQVQVRLSSLHLAKHMLPCTDVLFLQ